MPLGHSKQFLRRLLGGAFRKQRGGGAEALLAEANPCGAIDCGRAGRGGAERPPLALLEQEIGHAFAETEHLERALTHSSATHQALGNNERMELLGDAVLDLVICEHLFHTFPESKEGELTEIKSGLVRRATLARAACRFGLRPHIRLGRGIARRGQLPVSIYANVFEALVAAIYLDGGLDAARDFALRFLEAELEDLDRLPHTSNYKSLLQQALQKHMRSTPRYEVVGEEGPDHEKRFSVTVFSGDAPLGTGRGSNKKTAEQEAARLALNALGGEAPGTR